MSIINGFLTGLFDILLYPFRSMSPVVGLVIISAVLGIVLLLLYKYTSPQKSIKVIKNNIKAGLYEVRLYKDDLGIVFQANRSLLFNNLLYFGCACIALIPLLIVVIPIIIQLDHRYGIAPLEQGDKPYVKVVLDESVDFDAAEVRLEVPEGLSIDQGPVRIPSRHEYFYRLSVDDSGHYDLGVVVNGERFTKSIDAEEDLAIVSTGRFKSTRTRDAFESPGESPWPANALLAAVEVQHDGRKDMLGINGSWWPWLIIFCIVGLGAGLAMKGVFNVTI
jgi:hypothetical protein